MFFKPSLLHQLRRVRRKLQGERLAKGMAVILTTLFLASIIATLWLVRNNFSDTVVTAARISGIVLAAGLLIWFLIRPLWKRPTESRVARFLEERHPELQNRISTAVEVRQKSSRVHPQIQRLIEDDASRHLSGIDSPKLFYPGRSLFSIFGTAAVVAAFLGLFWVGPEAYRYSLDKLLRGWYATDQPVLYSIAVSPGNTKVVRHADVEVRAMLSGFSAEKARLLVKYENQPSWEAAEMRPDLEGNGFVFLFFDVREPLAYYVEADGIRSDQYQIEVSEVPGIEKLQVVLDYPRYTGLEDVVLEDEGDIRALRGTKAIFTVVSDQPVDGGQIRLENGGNIAFEKVSATEWKAELTVKDDDYYRIHLENLEGVWSPASDEFLIEALEDQPPSVSFTRPGRDKKVTNLEEVFTEAKVSDDYGISKATIFYSLNGDDEATVDLSIPRYTRSATGSHTFYLEEFDLVPGDFVSYYAEARDAVTTTQTDIYFLEVQPYDREYMQSQQGGGGGGGGQQEELFLSKLQKEIISATFNVIRRESTWSRAEFDENVQTLALMQKQLQQQAATIIERIERRAAAASNAMFRKMTEHLKNAAGFMEEAHSELNQGRPKPALTPEQKSLQQLLRAESLFKEIQLSMGGGQGGGGNSSAQELADLVDLELDRKKNQYETLQQNRQQDSDNELDEAARKLKELAQRQQQENERRRRMAQQGSGGGSSSQQELLEEIEELARQLERLSRRQQDPRLDDIARKLKQAARDLRESQASGQNSEEAQMRAQRALQRLQQARNTLNQKRQGDMSGAIEQVAREAKELAQRQEEVVDELQQLEQKQRESGEDVQWFRDANQLLREKGELQEDLQKLESELHQTARRLSSTSPEASRKLKQAGLGVRDQRIPEKMLEGSDLLRQRWTSLARQREEAVGRDLNELSDQVEAARQALGKGQQPQDARETGERALNQLGNLVEDLESLRERAQQQQGQAGQQEGEQQGQQGQQEGEQQGEQQGQQGQQGQQEGRQQGQQGRQGQQEGRQEGEQGQQGQQPGQQQGQGQQGQQEGRQEGQQGRGQQPGQQEGQQSSNVGGPQSQEPGARSTPRGGSLANSTGIDPQNVGREWQERIQDAERLRDLMRGVDRSQSREIADLARLMRQLDAHRIFDDPQEVARLKSQIIDGFRDLELQLYRSLEQEQGQLRLAHEDEVPPEFRKRVEEYYRALAEGRKP